MARRSLEIFGDVLLEQGTNINYAQPTMTPQQLMSLNQMLYSGGFGNPMDQDFMAMTSGINKLNYMC